MTSLGSKLIGGTVVKTETIGNGENEGLVELVIESKGKCYTISTEKIAYIVFKVKENL
jgi:hypothetical protein